MSSHAYEGGLNNYTMFMSKNTVLNIYYSSLEKTHTNP